MVNVNAWKDFMVPSVNSRLVIQGALIMVHVMMETAPVTKVGKDLIAL